MVPQEGMDGLHVVEISQLDPIVLGFLSGLEVVLLVPMDGLVVVPLNVLVVVPQDDLGVGLLDGLL
jgi:hypothetical protein